ncbi:MAG: dihydropteroate synthase [Calditrichia bacterium]
MSGGDGQQCCGDGSMMIRWLNIGFRPDFETELQGMQAAGGADDAWLQINHRLTFKFSGLPGDEKKRLQEWFRDMGVFTVSGNTHELLASFPAENRLREFLKDGPEYLSGIRHSLKQVKEGMETSTWEFSTNNGKLKIDRPLIMGILNITPDSFSDGGKFPDPESAVEYGRQMVEQGAGIIDMGAESTRPGAEAVPLQEEWRRIEPVLKKLRKKVDVPISMDTYKAEIARRALSEGADIINDISGMTFDEKMVSVAARFKSPVIMMHIKGTPRNMHKNPAYKNLMEEIFQYFEKRIEYARQNGVTQIIIDPGIGFGKRWQDNYEILRRLSEFRVFGVPLLLGPSRKSFIQKVDAVPAAERLPGTIAAVTAGILQGAAILRVHDVKEGKQAAAVARGIASLKA